LQRRGHDPERLLKGAMAGPLPVDHPTAALSYRIRKHLAARRRRPEPAGVEYRRPNPARSGPSLGM
jgi:hypothetical protein